MKPISACDRNEPKFGPEVGGTFSPGSLPPDQYRKHRSAAVAERKGLVDCPAFLDIQPRGSSTVSFRVECARRTYIAVLHWPGNVLELKNVIERTVLLSTEDRLELILTGGTSLSTESPFDDMPGIDEIQRRYIRHVLQTTGGRISGPGGAAEILGLPRTTLNARMKKLGISQKTK